MSVSPWVAVGALGDVMRDTLPDVRVLVVQSSGGAGEAAAAAAEMAALALGRGSGGGGAGAFAGGRGVTVSPNQSINPAP